MRWKPIEKYSVQTFRKTFWRYRSPSLPNKVTHFAQDPRLAVQVDKEEYYANRSSK